MSEEQDQNLEHDEQAGNSAGTPEETPAETPDVAPKEVPEDAPEGAQADATGGERSEAPGKSNPEDASEDDAEAAMLAMMEGGEVGEDDSSLDDRLADLPEADKISPGSIDYSEQVAQRADFQQLSSDSSTEAPRSIDMLLDVSLPISIELGRTKMSISDILALGPGSVVELNKLAGEPVEVLVNQKTVAFGEVVVVDENFGVRITQLMSPADRMKSLTQ